MTEKEQMTPFSKLLARFVMTFIVSLSVVLPASSPALAQNLFAPAVHVNDDVVSNYEMNQRIIFLRFLNQPGDLEAVALEGLIDDRLRSQAARALGISASEEDILLGMEEFAARAELSAEQLIGLLAQAGIAEESFRDFVNAGIVWRQVIQARFVGRTQITESEIDRAIALSSSQGGVRVLLSEVILPTAAGEASARRRADQISRITTLPAFASAARNYSASQTRGRGGRLDWLPIGNLPPEIRTQVLTLAPGEVTDPIDIPNAIILFQLRAIEETDAPNEEAVSIEYASYFINGGHSTQALSEAARVADRIDTCDDLYAVAQGQPEETLVVNTLPVAEIPADIAMELAGLDENEVSTNLTRSNGDTLMFLMLCGRVTEQLADIPREQIRERLLNQRLTSYANSYLAELRADAVIVTP